MSFAQMSLRANVTIPLHRITFDLLLGYYQNEPLLEVSLTAPCLQIVQGMWHEGRPYFHCLWKLMRNLKSCKTLGASAPGKKVKRCKSSFDLPEGLSQKGELRRHFSWKWMVKSMLANNVANRPLWKLLLSKSKRKRESCLTLADSPATSF